MKILAIDPKELRECPKCGKTKELSRFIVKSKRNNGQARWCQDCRREYKKNYDTKNAEKIKNKFKEKKDQYNAARRQVYSDSPDEIRTRLKTWYDNNTRSRLYSSAKRRAKVRKLDFDITPQDVIVPEKCPVLGIELIVGTGCSHDQSPSLDRIIPSKGYVKGNIIVVSHKANSIKNNATVEEIKKVYDFYKSIEGSTSNNENS